LLESTNRNNVAEREELEKSWSLSQTLASMQMDKHLDYLAGVPIGRIVFVCGFALRHGSTSNSIIAVPEGPVHKVIQG
jgi:hypothetical protein